MGNDHASSCTCVKEESSFEMLVATVIPLMQPNIDEACSLLEEGTLFQPERKSIFGSYSRMGW